MNTNDAVKYINTWVTRNSYGHVFKGSAQTILQENRRHTRPNANAVKYGKIDHTVMPNGHVHYDLLDIKEFCETKLRPLCEDIISKKLAQIAKLKYYTPYVLPVMTEAELDEALELA